MAQKKANGSIIKYKVALAANAKAVREAKEKGTKELAPTTNAPVTLPTFTPKSRELSIYNQAARTGAENRDKQERDEITALYAMPTADVEKKVAERDKAIADLETANKIQNDITYLENYLSTNNSTNPRTANAVKAAQTQLDDLNKKLSAYDMEALKTTSKGLAYTTIDNKSISWDDLLTSAKGRDAKASVDYDEYVAKGKGFSYTDVGTKGTTTRGGEDFATYDSVGLAAAAMNYFDGKEVEEIPPALLDKYKRMQPEEMDLFAYYLAKDKADGTTRAQEYLDAIDALLEYRAGEAIAYKAEGNFGKQLENAADAGLMQFASGIGTVFGAKQKPNATQFASQMIREDLANKGIKIGDTSLGQLAYDITLTSANMLPSIGASIIAGMVNPTAGAVVGNALMGASATGNAYQEALNLGYTKDEARSYGILVGASEAALQYALGGIGGLASKTGLASKITKALSGVDNGLARFALTIGGKASSEALEEGVQTILEPIFKAIVTGENIEAVDWDEVAYSALLGALSAGMFETAPTAVDTIAGEKAKINVGRDIIKNKELEALKTEAGKFADNKAVKKSLENVGKKENARNAYSLARAVAKADGTIKAETAKADLVEGGLTEREAEIVSEYVDKVSKGYKPTEAERAKIETITSKMESVGENLNETEADSSEDFASEAEEANVSKNPIIEEKATESEFEASPLMTKNKVESPKVTLESAASKYGAQAGAMMHTYNAGQDVEKYDAAYRAAYNMGRDGVKINYVMKSPLVAYLNPTQREVAYQAGVDAINAQRKKKGEGKVIYEGATALLKTSELQSTSLRAVNFLSKALGVDVHVFDSQSEEYKGKNGFYDHTDRSIWIDIHSGNTDEGTILYTMAHELTHFIQAWSKTKYEAFADFLLENYAEKGVDIDDLVKAQIEKAAQHGDILTEDEAFDEVIADSCEAMLADGDVLTKIAELKERDQSLWEKIVEYITALVDKVKAVYKDLKPDSAEGKFVAEQLETFEELKRLWTEALVEASENYGAGVEIDTNTQSVAPSNSLKTWTESSYVTEREKMAKKIAEKLGVSYESALHYIDDINSVAKLIADDRVRLDYDENVDPDATSLKKNSEYKWSVDMSTLCPKRYLYTSTFDAIQRKMPNTVFNSEDLVELRAMMLARGYEVACGICYVESTRREIGRITQDFIDRYKKAQKTGEPITRVNSKGEEVPLKKKKQFLYADADYTPTLAELNTTDIDFVKRDHRDVYDAYLAFMNARGQAKPKLLETRTEYKGEILRAFKSPRAVAARNRAGGLRVQSFSDFETVHMIDMMQIILDMSAVGLKSQAYTKMPDFADVFGGTGMKINLSLIAKGSGLDANGNLIFDNVQGMPADKAFALREKYSKNVGTILVGKNDAHIIAAMADPRIDFIIPFHKSSWKESLYEVLGLTGYTDYSDSQNEKSLDPSKKIKNYDPSEYWDSTKSGNENAQIYLEKCRAEGRIPKFPQFATYDGYWKLLIDFKMYDNDGNFSAQEEVRPEFDMEAAERILGEYEGGHRQYKPVESVVDDFIAEYKTKTLDRATSGEFGTSATWLKNPFDNTLQSGEKGATMDGRKQFSRKDVDESYNFLEDDDYINFGWVRRNDLISSGYWRNFTSEFSKAVATGNYYNKTPTGEYIIPIYDEDYSDSMVDVVVFAKGTIKSPVVVKITKILPSDLEDVEGWRRSLIEIERRGIQQEIEGIFYTYHSADFRRIGAGRRNGTQNERYNNGFNADRRTGGRETKRVVGFHVNDDGSTTYSYSDGSTINELESTKKHSYKDTDTRDLTPEHQALLAGLMAQGRADAKMIRTRDERLAETKAYYREAQARGIEGRTKTELRGKIKRKVNELNTLLLNGNRNSHVPLKLREAVAMALEAVNMDTITAQARINALLEKERALFAEEQKALAKGDQAEVKKIRANIDKLNKSRDYIEERGDKLKEKLDKLDEAYREIIADKQGDVVDLEEAKLILEKIIATKEKIKDTAIRDMSLSQLQAVYDLYKMVLKSVRDANKLFREGKKESISNNAFTIMEEVRKYPALPEERVGNFDSAKSFAWNELTPIYAFRRIGSSTLEKFYWDLVKAQDVYARDTADVTRFAEETRKKYGYDKWDMNKVIPFKTLDGREMELTLGHMMSIYAYSKRPQAKDHIEYGGFFFNDKETFRKTAAGIELKRSNEAGYKFTLPQLNAIIDALTVEQIQYVDEMQDFMSQFGERGNEASRILWDIDLFKEEHYFPLKSKDDFIKRENEVKQSASLKNDGMTKETVPGASNPIVLEKFDNVWANHLERMSKYHAFVVPLDNINKVFHYGTWRDANAEAVTTVVESRFGKGAVEYINALIDDLNGNNKSSGATIAFLSGLFGKFKKTAVAGSLSVVVQQPTAVIRAMSVIDAKYFGALDKVEKTMDKTWDEIKQYAPIALIKEIGGFDAGSGRRVESWINKDTLTGIDKASQKFDDATMWGAAQADMLGWSIIWNAVKREMIHKHHDLSPTSKKFLELCGERFTEVITLTQVYDSTLSRSGLMRSKNDLTKQIVSFMGEPTLSLNMLVDAILQLKRKKINGANASRIIASVYLAQISAILAKSFVYALRDDDEEKSYMEKYAQAVGGSLSGGKWYLFAVSELSPITWIPFLRDIASVLQGYDIERADMSVIMDLYKAITTLDSKKKSTWRKIEDITGAFGAIFGIPAKNLLRTVREMYSVYENIADGVSGNVGKGFANGFLGE